MTYGITTEGFASKSLETTKLELEAAFRAAFGAGIDLSPQTPFGQLVGIFAEREAELWELAEGVYLAFDPDAAAGAQLDSIAGITGVLRLVARPSTVTAIATGTPGTVLPAGREVAVTGAGTRFQTLADATITALDPRVGNSLYPLGERVTSAGRVYECVVDGMAGLGGGPTTTDEAIVDGAVTWRYLGEGTGIVEIDCESVSTGPLPAAAGTLIEIVTPVSGWSSVTNLADAELGRNIETDAALRARREALLRSQGKATVDAIRADVLAVDGVTATRVFENATDTTDGDGVPAHAFEVLVRGGDDDAIAQAIWDSKPAGILAHGSASGTAVDAEGSEHVVDFSRPTEVPIYVSVLLLKDDAVWGATSADLVTDALLAYGATFATGDDVIASALLARVFAVPGVIDVTAVRIGTAPAPALSGTIGVEQRQLATFAAARITVTAS